MEVSTGHTPLHHRPTQPPLTSGGATPPAGATAEPPEPSTTHGTAATHRRHPHGRPRTRRRPTPAPATPGEEPQVLTLRIEVRLEPRHRDRHILHAPMERHGDQQPPTRPQHPPRLQQQVACVGHVLEHLRAPHEVDGAVAPAGPNRRARAAGSRLPARHAEPAPAPPRRSRRRPGPRPRPAAPPRSARRRSRGRAPAHRPAPRRAAARGGAPTARARGSSGASAQKLS